MAWTPEQSAAITARGASVVVSAAAGSGKTSVLTERIAELLSDPAYPAEKMVVVTFTRDAAEEMRTRISAALAKAESEEQRDAYERLTASSPSASSPTPKTNGSAASIPCCKVRISPQFTAFAFR